ncbi:MAG TPA: multicopper oxidase domain-containing protein [Opitutaceae bacterium]|nr:multicopper oxidase domain-containing protein [Opitutaceae bacterium]
MLAAAHVHAQPDEPPPPVRPTATVGGGDTGGLFFGQKPDPARSRQYYIAAESELWDYAPSGKDDVCGMMLPPPVVAQRKGGKLRYIQYTDATFTTRVIGTPSLGILGPVLRGAVGDNLVITFLNRTTQPLSLHPHGVKYDKDSEGAYYRPGPGRGGAVDAGAKFTYVWFLDEASGPLPGEPSSKGWLYHSHVNGDSETLMGLMGCIIVTDAKRARPDGTPADVDREFATLFMIFDESGLGDAELEAAEYGTGPDTAGLLSPPPSWAQVLQMREMGSRYAINGYIFGNLPGLEMNEGERTRWYLFGLGSEQDLHTAHWHGLRVIEEGRRRTDVVDLLPATMKVADMVADNPGSWLFHCHVAEHMREGMFSRLVVHPRNAVGVDRSPAHAFLGLRQAEQSLRLDRAEAVLTLGISPVRAEIILAGVATVFDGFAAYNQAVHVQIGGRTLSFQPDRHGMAKEPRASFRIKNANEFGVVRGGLLEFELVLNGADWLGEITSAAAGAAPGAAQDVPLTLELGTARHVTTARIVRRMQRP